MLRIYVKQSATLDALPVRDEVMDQDSIDSLTVAILAHPDRIMFV